MASLVVGAIFIFFLLVIIGVGMLRGTSLVPVGKKIGVLQVRGVIVDAQRLIEQIDEFRDANTVKAVVLRINSPGGGVGPSQEIYAELKRLAAEKPLIVSMGSVAASGGYYIAVAGERLFANPGTITGSIGVIMSFPNYQGIMAKIGIRNEVVESGRFKDIGSATRDFTSADRKLLQGMVDNVHSQFVTAISEGRNIPVDRLQPYVDGRVFTGQQALEFGLIDELGTFGDAVRYAGDIAGLGDNPKLVYPDPEEKPFFERLIQGAASRYLGISMNPGIAAGPQYLWDGY